MKRFYVQNGKELVVVNEKNLQTIVKYNIVCPTEVLNEYNEQLSLEKEGKYNRINYVIFYDPKSVDYFKNEEWVIDFDKYMEHSTIVLKNICKKVQQEKSAVAKLYNSFNSEEKTQNTAIYQEYFKKETMYNELNEVVKEKDKEEKGKSLIYKK